MTPPSNSAQSAHAGAARASGFAPTLLRLPDLDRLVSASPASEPKSSLPISAPSGDVSLPMASVSTYEVAARAGDADYAVPPISAVSPLSGSVSVSAPAPHGGWLEVVASRGTLAILLLLVAGYAMFGPSLNHSSIVPDESSETGDQLAASESSKAQATNTEGPEESVAKGESIASIALPVVGNHWFEPKDEPPATSELAKIPFDPPSKSSGNGLSASLAGNQSPDESPRFSVGFASDTPSPMSGPPQNPIAQTAPPPTPQTTGPATNHPSTHSSTRSSDASASPFVAESLAEVRTVPKEPSKPRPTLSETPHGVEDWTRYLPGLGTNSLSTAQGETSAPLITAPTPASVEPTQPIDSFSGKPSATPASPPRTTGSPIEPSFDFALPDPGQIAPTAPHSPEARVATPTPNPPTFR